MSDPLHTSLIGKVAIVTGASSGIGAATAVMFARLHASVVLTGRNCTDLEATSALCVDAGLKEEQVRATLGDITVNL